MWSLFTCRRSPIHLSPSQRGRLGVAPTPPSPPRPSPSFLRLFRHSCTPHRRSCAGRNPRIPTASPKNIHPSPLLGGRLGGGWDAPSVCQPPSNTPIASPVRSPTRPSVIPAQAGTHTVGAARIGFERSAAARKPLGWAVKASRRVRNGGDRLDSCLRRNDGKGAGMTTEGAGMTVGGRNGGSANAQKREAGDTSERWRQFVASHPPPNLPPKRGEG